jgi:N-acetylneuraminic acid mutarotase
MKRFDYQQGIWSDINISPQPSGRAFHAMFNGHGQESFLLHGGIDLGSNTVYSDAWIFDSVGMIWTSLQTSGPTYALQSHTIVYDSVKQVYLINGTLQFFNV